MSLKTVDAEVYRCICDEAKRQAETIELIASENATSEAVMEAQGSLFTNKYAEGYPRKRYYGGCEHADEVEQLAIDRVKELFAAEAANVQPHSGSGANMGVYLTELSPGDAILGMSLASGGHLTHGSKVNFSGKLFESHFYGVDPETGWLDMNQVMTRAREVRPKLIVAGASAYSRLLDFKAFREVADAVGAVLLVDMAHIAGLVAANIHPSPVPYADYVTTTTHKTLRGPRGGLILCKQERLKKLNSTLFPGIQGGPLMHVIAAKAVAFKEAMSTEFQQYQQKIVQNAQTMATELLQRNFSILSGGTDNHLLLVSLLQRGITGKQLETSLDMANITLNKNAIPNDPQSPFVTSGVRIGTPTITTRQMGTPEIKQIAEWIDIIAKNADNHDVINDIKKEVIQLTKAFPLYSDTLLT